MLGRKEYCLLRFDAWTRHSVASIPTEEPQNKTGAKALGPSMESNLLSISLGQFIMGMDAGPTIPNDGLP